MPLLRPRETAVVFSRSYDCRFVQIGDAKTKAIILLPLLLLAACGTKAEVKVTNASLAEVADKVQVARQDSDFLRPGKWLTKASVDEINVPGMSPELAAQMKQRRQGMAGTETCITEADRRKPNADFFTGNKTCKYEHFSMGGGKIEGRMRCGAGDGTQLTAMTGTYAPDSYAMALSTVMENPAQGSSTGMAGMTMKLSVEGKRIGECDAATAGKVAAQ